MKSFITIFLFLLSIIARAQSADALYEAGKNSTTRRNTLKR